jgi:hypothetical protein
LLDLSIFKISFSKNMGEVEIVLDNPPPTDLLGFPRPLVGNKNSMVHGTF